MPEPNRQLPPGSADPNVVIPASVLAASQRADEVHRQTYQPQEQPNGHTYVDGNGQLPQQQELPLQPPELPETNPDGTANWENRWKALKGRYDADQRRWNETQQEYDQRMQQMRHEVQRATTPPLPGTGDVPRMITQKEIDDYGPDLIDVMKRVAMETQLSTMKPIATAVGQIQARVETTEQEASRQFLNRMHSSLDNAVPIWQDLNKDPNFIAWTKRSDVYSGLNRQELLQRAWYAGDSNRVAAFFQGYLAEEAAVDPAAAQARQQAYGNGYGGHAAAPNGFAAGPASPAQQPAPRVTLESLAAPGRARAAAVAPVGKPVWTAAGISEFYMDCAAGKFRGRDAERLATEQDLMMAQREGRIQVNPRTATTLGSS